MSTPQPDPDAWCSVLSAWSGEPMAGSAPRAAVWVVVEQPEPWGSAPLTRSEHGVRVVMARPVRGHERPPQVWIARPGLAEPTLTRAPLTDPREIADWDLAAVAAGDDPGGEAVADPLLLVCTNGRRDRCCGHIGRRLVRELAPRLDAAGLSDSLLTCTHLGGHRFAPTALLLPWGALHGRLELDSALAVLTEARADRSPTLSLRGYSTLSQPAQVAEVHARAETGYAGLSALPVTVQISASEDEADALVEIPGHGTLRVNLHREASDVLPSCGKHLEPTPRWVVTRSQLVTS